MHYKDYDKIKESVEKIIFDSNVYSDDVSLKDIASIANKYGYLCRTLVHGIERKAEEDAKEIIDSIVSRFGIAFIRRYVRDQKKKD